MQNFQIAKAKKQVGLPLLQRLDLSGCMKGDEQVCQLAQSSYLKDLKYLNIKSCKFGDIGLLELLSSKNMRSVRVLIASDNRIEKIEGPFGDLEDASEKQLKKGVMKLQLLDVRKNKLTNIIQKHAVQFLKETIVLMWDNPLNEAEINAELLDPRTLFSAYKFDYDPKFIPNPLHMFTARKQFLEL